MRRRGELLVIFDVENCVLIGPAFATSSRTLATAEVVAGWKSSGKGGFGPSYGSTTDSSGIAASIPTAAPRVR